MDKGKDFLRYLCGMYRVHDWVHVQETKFRQIYPVHLMTDFWHGACAGKIAFLQFFLFLYIRENFKKN